MTQLFEYVKMAVASVYLNKWRSLLTMLGIIIGITSVVTIVSIGNGVKQDMLNTIETADQVNITMNTATEGTMQTIKQDDILLLEEQLDDNLDGVIVSTQFNGKTETRKGDFDLDVVFTSADAIKISYQKDMYAGRYFVENEVARGEHVCVIDKYSAINMFGTQDVIDVELDVEVNGTIESMRIIGVKEMSEADIKQMKELESMYGFKFPVTVEIPYTVTNSFPDIEAEFGRVTLLLKDVEKADIVTNAAVRLLNNRYRAYGENLFMEEQSMDMSAAFGAMMDMVTAFIAFVAGISLLVGGIGVMNIMLVSVTERTREIGIRKSLGAKTSSIVTQFLCESAIISGIGGIIGILLGASFTAIINVTNIGGLTAHLSLTAVIGATLFSCGVGIVFGIYPTRKAAKMRPIDALRQM